MSPESANKPQGVLGGARARVDGRLKTTGAARYAADYRVPDCAHGYAVQSTIPCGRIASLDAARAWNAPGVVAVLTHLNAPKLAGPSAQVEGSPFVAPWVLQSDRIDHYGEYVAVVIAETFEQARDAARLVRVEYAAEPGELAFAANANNRFVPDHFLGPDMKPVSKRGDAEQALAESSRVFEAVYVVPTVHNNPMEPHATLALWEDKNLTVYESSQHVNWAQQTFARAWGISPDRVRVISRFIGGGFGCKVPLWEHALLATMAAKVTGRPVKIALPRRQMFSGVGYRPLTMHRMRIGAAVNGRLSALAHEIITPANIRREYIEPGGLATPMMYAVPNLLVRHEAVALNWPRGTIMRGPGVTPCLFALESAMDELAVALDMDPIALRFKNEPATDPQSGKPWSSRHLTDCFKQGARAFGWNRRNPVPGMSKDGRHLIGMGTAAATFPAKRAPTSARVMLDSEGKLRMQLAATDIGTGTYTILTQIAASTLGMAEERVTVEIGDSALPPTPGSGGSHGAASYGTAVQAACESILAQIVDLARKDEASPVYDVEHENIIAGGGGLRVRGNAAAPDSFAAILSRQKKQKEIIAEASIKPGAQEAEHSSHAFGAHFAEVRVDRDTGEARVSRFLGAFAAGRILNPLTAESQFKGCIVMGIGMALMEASVMDERHGAFVNSDLANYHVPVHRDIPKIDVLMLGEKDTMNPLGAKGIGELALTGVAAAVANAVYNATGRRIRELPITPDKLL